MGRGKKGRRGGGFTPYDPETVRRIDAALKADKEKGAEPTRRGSAETPPRTHDSGGRSAGRAHAQEPPRRGSSDALHTERTAAKPTPPAPKPTPAPAQIARAQQPQHPRQSGALAPSRIDEGDLW